MANNMEANTHASFVQVAIDQVVKQANIELANIDAVVVTMGPGSYTGLRVGLSSAKGIAYALQKPLIGLSTLGLLAHRAIQDLVKTLTSAYQIFSMIEARKMEVFGAIYNDHLEPIIEPQAIELTSQFLEQLIQNGPLVCIGTGTAKAKELLQVQGIYFIDAAYTIQDMMEMAKLHWNQSKFEDIAYSSPAYLKEFYQIPSKSASEIKI